MSSVPQLKMGKIACLLMLVIGGGGLLLAPGLIRGWQAPPVTAATMGLPPAQPAGPGEVVINEVAWGGTAAGAADEWLELLNVTTRSISLNGWVITSANGLSLDLSGVISPGGYYLIERSDDAAVGDVEADLTASFGSGLRNGGDGLFLVGPGLVVDTANRDGGPWPAGTGSPDYLSMERVEALAGDTAANWRSNDTVIRTGRDAAGKPLNGTPKQANSAALAIPAGPGEVVINEVAWGGTAAGAADEWLELLNVTTRSISLDGWVITSANGLSLDLSGVISPGGYYLIERSDDAVVGDVEADLTASFGSGLRNGGDSLFLAGPGLLVDTANRDGGSWPAGSGSPDYLSMERVEALAGDTAANWRSNDTVIRTGRDAAGKPLNGTPKQANSAALAIPAGPGEVVINEVAWGGTAAGAADEWLELLNVTTRSISLDGWVITGANGLSLDLSGVISPGGYYLIERSDDDAVGDIEADLTASFGSGLRNGGDSLFLAGPGLLVDTANRDGGSWPAGSGSPEYLSMERVEALAGDTAANWRSNDTVIRTGRDAAGEPLNGTPKQANSAAVPPPPAQPLLIGEFLYDGLTPATEGDEFVEICNPTAGPVDLSGYKIGDEASRGGGESMYRLPPVMLGAGACWVVAKNAGQFWDRFGMLPDAEVVVSGAKYSDHPAAPNLTRYTLWGSGRWSLANNGDELLLVGPADTVVDSVAYRQGDYAGLGLEPPGSAPEPDSLQRVWPVDTGSMPHDFVRAEPTPGLPTIPLPPPPVPPAPAILPGGMRAYWGHLHAHTSYSDGAGPPYYALAQARAAGLHFYAITDHGWWLTPAEWAATLSQTNQATAPGRFIALRGVEWSHRQAGHLNVFNSDVLLSREDPLFGDLAAVYTWLAARPEVIAQFNHPDPSYGGTFYDFAFHPAAAGVISLQEIGNNAQGYVTYEPSFVQSLLSGWQVGPAINGDTHTAAWGFDMPARTGLVAPALTRADLLAAMRARRVFATEDSNLALSLRAGDLWMGGIAPEPGRLSLTVDIIDPDAEPVTLQVYDTNLLLAERSFAQTPAQWSASVDLRAGHAVWVKAVQADGDRAYSAPLRVAGTLEPEVIYINEILPAPGDVDWDGDGTAGRDDEWLELYNPNDRPVGLGGWRLTDNSRLIYDIPLSVTIPARGFVTLYRAQVGFGLNNGGDTITLRHPGGAVVDTATYDHTPGYDESWCRLPDGGADWSDDCQPSPGGANWERVTGPLSVSIFEAKRLTDKAWVKVRGRVTVPPGVLGARSMYIQDEAAGILIYLPKDHRFNVQLGDKVEVAGNLRSFYHETEIIVSKRSSLRRLEGGAPPPPLPIATTSLLEPYEGRLVMLQGRAVGFRGRSRFWIDDGTDPAQVYIRRRTGIRKPFIPAGTPLTVVGVVSQYSRGRPSRDDYRLLPRYPTDLVLPAESTATSDSATAWPDLLPETGE